MKLRKIVALVLSVCILSGMLIVQVGAEERTQRYSDVPVTHWAYAAIERVAEKAWFRGYPNGTFAPTNKITRSEALVVMARFLGLEITEYTGTPFHDITGTEWYAPYVQATSDLLPTHTAAGANAAFQAAKPITREDVIYALVKAMGYSSKVQYVDESVLNMYDDQNSISADVRACIAFAVSDDMKLISGKRVGDKTMIAAQDPLSRAEFATMLYRASGIGVGPDGWFTGNGAVRSVTVSPSEPQSLSAGGSFTITAKTNYTDGSTKDYEGELAPYNASNNDVVTIEGNVVKAAAPGTCEIKFGDGRLAETSIQVTVNSYPIDSVELKPDSDQQLVIGEGFKLTATASYSDGSKDDYTAMDPYEAENLGVVEIRDGLVTGVKVGMCTIRFRDDQLKEKSVKVTVVRGDSNLNIGLYDIPTVTSADSYTFAGTTPVSMRSDVTLTCNGETVSIDERGWFTVQLPLTAGENTFTFILTNSAGRCNSKTVTITKQ